MRALIVDQDSEMLESIARTFEVDIATSKATCVDLLRANPFDVLVACERLEDGSGLELLSHVAQRWPDTVRILAIEPHRRTLLRGKLAPFKLFAAIRYPIDEKELERVLEEARDLGDTPAAPAASPQLNAKVTAQVSVPPAKHVVTGATSPSTRSQATPALTRTAPEPMPRAARGPAPLGSANEAGYRIVPRQFDVTGAPLAARAVRAREQAAKQRTVGARITAQISRALARLRGRGDS